MPVTYSATTSLTATSAAITVAVDTGHAAPSGWAYSTGSAIIPTTSVATRSVVIEFYLGAGVGLWVCSDATLIGGATPGAGVIAAGAASTIFLAPGQTQPSTIGNLQSAPNWNAQSGVATYRSGYDMAYDQSEAVGLTAQAGFSGVHNAGDWPYGPNFLAFIPQAASAVTGYVDITFQ